MRLLACLLLLIALPPTLLAEPPSLESLIAQLDARRYAAREAASQALIARGTAALPALREAAKAGSPERQRRLARVIEQIELASEALAPVRDAPNSLVWLAGQQAKDGSWGGPGLTSLVLLAYLAQGETHKAGTHRARIAAGLRFLTSQPGAAEGKLARRPRAQLIATLALCEASGMSGDPALARVATKALAHSLSLQAADGGWPAAGDQPAPLFWAALALRSARSGDIVHPGLKAAHERLGKHLAGIDARQAPSARLAELVVGRLMCGAPRDAAIAAGFERVLADKPVWRGPASDCHGLYVRTLASFMAGGKANSDWLARMQHAFAKGRIHQGLHASSWPGPVDQRARKGRVRATAYATLALTVAGRYDAVFAPK